MGVASQRVVPIITRREKETIMAAVTKVDEHATRIERLEKNDADLEYITNTIKKIWRAVKVGGPTILAFLVGGGYVGNDVANGIKAVLGM